MNDDYNYEIPDDMNFSVHDAQDESLNDSKKAKNQSLKQSQDILSDNQDELIVPKEDSNVSNDKILEEFDAEIGFNQNNTIQEDVENENSKNQSDEEEKDKLKESKKEESKVRRSGTQPAKEERKSRELNESLKGSRARQSKSNLADKKNELDEIPNDISGIDKVDDLSVSNDLHEASKMIADKGPELNKSNLSKRSALSQNKSKPINETPAKKSEHSKDQVNKTQTHKDEDLEGQLNDEARASPSVQAEQEYEVHGEEEPGEGNGEARNNSVMEDSIPRENIGEEDVKNNVEINNEIDNEENDAARDENQGPDNANENQEVENDDIENNAEEIENDKEDKAEDDEEAKVQIPDQANEPLDQAEESPEDVGNNEKDIDDLNREIEDQVAEMSKSQPEEVQSKGHRETIEYDIVETKYMKGTASGERKSDEVNIAGNTALGRTEEKNDTLHALRGDRTIDKMAQELEKIPKKYPGKKELNKDIEDVIDESHKTGAEEKKVITGKKPSFDEKVVVKKARKGNKKDRVLVNTNMKPSMIKPPADKSKEQKRLAEREANWDGRFTQEIHVSGTQARRPNDPDNA